VKAEEELALEIKRRREAEHALEASREFLEAVLDNIDAGIVACDETGTLKLFNNATRTFHGIPEAPIPAEAWPAQYDLYCPDGITLMRKEDVPLFRAFSGEVVRQAEMVIAPKNGPRRTVLASGRALIGRDGRKLGAVVAMQDITHRKIAAARARQALRQFRALFNDAPIAYHEIDRQGIIRRVNRAECRLLERTRDDIIGLPAWAFAAEHERDKDRNAVFEKLSGLHPLEPVEWEYLTPSGKRLVLQLHENLIHDRTGEITGIRTAMLDITDRIGREQAQTASAEIRSILERIGDAYMAFDTEWRYTYVNRKAAELALKPASELIGRRVWDEFPESVHTPFFRELQRALRDQAPIEFDNYYKPLGKWFANSVYPSPSGVGVFYRDITERVNIQTELEKRTAELTRKNAELEAFAYIASHDLQEPLRIISGYAALLTKRYSDALDEDAKEFISFISQGTERMQRLIKDLLALCRVSEASAPLFVSDVNVARIVDLACGNLDLLIEDTAAVVIRDNLPTVRFNETHLLQVMQNLIGNALKYRSESPPRNRIRHALCRSSLSAVQTAAGRGGRRDRHRTDDLPQDCREPRGQDMGGIRAGERLNLLLYRSGRAAGERLVQEPIWR
jgi:PAS domain S-box-containing protein